MSSALLDPFLPSLSAYTNEIVATGLFGIGYYLYRVFSDKTAVQPPPKAKEMTLTSTSPLQYYNQGLKMQILKMKNVNPAEILHQIELEGLKPDISTFNTLMDGCFETGNLKQGFWVFEEMKSNGMSYVKPDLVSYNVLMKGVGLNGGSCFDEVLDEMLSNGLTPNLTTFNTIIDHCLRTKDLRKTLKYLKSMRDNFLEIDYITITLLYRSLRDHDLNDVLKFCEEAQQIIGMESEILYNIRIEACFNHGDPSTAISLIEEMRSLEFPLSAMTYGVILKGLGLYKDLKGINKLLAEIMSERPEITENDITMGCLIDGMVRCGAVEQAEDVLLKIPKLASNLVILSTILKGFTKKKNMKKALEVFQTIIDNKLRPNIIAYNSLLECAIQSGNFEKAEELFLGLKDEAKADIITYSSYMKGLLKQRKLKETMDLLEELRIKRKKELDEVLYNTLMDGLVKLKEANLALKVYGKMKEDGVKAGVVSYSILMKANSLKGETEEIFKLFEEMKTLGHKPGLIVYTCVIQNCVKTKKIEEMLKIYEEMIDFEIKPDEVFLNIFISGLCFNNYAKLASQMLRNALDRNVTLNVEVYGNVLRSLLRCIYRNWSGLGEIKGNLTKKDAELEILRISCGMRKSGINIELGLYNDIARVLMFQAEAGESEGLCGQKKRIPKFINRNLKK